MREVLNITEAVRTNIPIVDACTACILKAYREKRGIKALYLQPRYYYQFRDAVIRKIGERAFFDIGKGKIEYYQVNIEMGERKQAIAILPEYWPEILNQPN